MSDKALSAEHYRNKILEMVNAINNPEYLYKIYHYITVPYKMETEKQKKDGE